MLVSVPLLGSSKAGVTKIVVGTNPDLTAKYTALEKRIDQEKANEEALEKLIKQMVALKDPKGLLPRLKVSRQHAMQVWGQSLLEKKELEQQIALTMTAKVSVGVAVEGAVDLCIGSQSTRLRREFSGGAFSLDIANHVVVFADVSGTSNIVR
jgi:uncharacterized protein (DUF342 family)